MGRKKKLEIIPKTESVKMNLIVSPAFRQGFALLMGGSITVKTAYQILIINDELEKLYVHYEELRRSLVEKYGQRDEKNELIMDEKKTKYLLKDEAAFEIAFKELLDLDVKVSKIPLSSVIECKLPPALLAVMLKTVVNSDL